MALKIPLSSTLRRHHPGYDPSTGIDLDLDKPVTVAQLCKLLNIPSDHIKVVMVDGRSQSMDFVLKGHERVGLFPPVGGG